MAINQALTGEPNGFNRMSASKWGSLPIGRWLLMTVVIGWFAVLILVPTVALARQAFAAGLAPLGRAMASDEFLRAFGMTIGITLVAVVVNTIFGVCFALVLVRQRFWCKTLADGLVDLPFAISPVVTGLMLVVLYGPDGWIGRYLEAGGFKVVYALPGMILATLFVTLPFVVRGVVPVLQEFGVDQVEAAYILGAGRWVTFWRVTLPSIRWGLAYSVLLLIARSLGEFGAVMVVSGNLLGHTQTATLYVHDGIEGFRPEGAYAASLLLAAVSFFMLIGMGTLRKRVKTSKQT